MYFFPQSHKSVEYVTFPRHVKRAQKSDLDLQSEQADTVYVTLCCSLLPSVFSSFISFTFILTKNTQTSASFIYLSS